MKEQLKANITANLKFFQRSGVIRVVLLIMLVYGGIALMFSLFLEDTGVKFRLIQSVSNSLNIFFYLIVVLLGILAVHHHVRSRCLKMVFTKPCPPRNWLLSLYISIVAAGFVLFLFNALTQTLLFWVWNVPFQAGGVYASLVSLLNSLAASFILLLLGTWMSPFLAVLLYLFLDDTSFYYLTVFAASAMGRTTSAVPAFFLALAERVFYFIYMVLPLTPFQDSNARIMRTWIVIDGDWPRLGLHLLYVASLGALLFLVTARALKRRRIT